MKSINFMFVVQGEGRGHMTQAIALYKLLIENGHQISAVLVGKSKRREIPAFFFEHIKTEIIPFESPNFVTDKQNKSIKVKKTIVSNLLNSKSYYGHLKKIDKIIADKKPDCIINFYDFLAGMYYFLFHSKVPLICIGHQYLLEHPDFIFPEKVKKSDRFWYMINTKITHHGALKKMALSFREMNDSPKDNIIVVPPLLRTEVLELIPENQGHILVYMVNAGFSDDILQWHKKNKQHKIHLFCDRNDWTDGQIFNETLTFFKINDKRFLESMRTCKAFASTAGFESICEAMYLNKPVMMVPPEGHFEQQCNALDAELAGAGIQSNTFDLDKLIAFAEKKQINNDFKKWVEKANHVFLNELTNF